MEVPGPPILIRKTLLACVFAAVLGTYLAFPILSHIVWGQTPKMSWHGVLDALTWPATSFGGTIYVILVAISFMALIVVGAPVQFILQKLGVTKLWPTLLVATSLGALTFPVMAYLAIPAVSFIDLLTLRNLLSGTIIAPIYALIAWLIRRPDKDGSPLLEARPDGG